MAHLRDSLIVERRRHRYEFNRDYEAVLTGEGVRITAQKGHTGGYTTRQAEYLT